MSMAHNQTIDEDSPNGSNIISEALFQKSFCNQSPPAKKPVTARTAKKEPHITVIVTVGCKNQARTGGKCRGRGANAECTEQGCTNQARTGGKCRSHRANAECTEAGCKNQATTGGKCGRHRANAECTEVGCKSQAITGGKCRSHRANAECTEVGCNNQATTGGMCKRHRLAAYVLDEPDTDIAAEGKKAIQAQSKNKVCDELESAPKPTKKLTAKPAAKAPPAPKEPADKKAPENKALAKNAPANKPAAKKAPANSKKKVYDFSDDDIDYFVGDSDSDVEIIEVAVTARMHALPKRKEPESKKKAAAAGKKKRGRDSDDNSDGGESSKRAKSPFDDKTLRKKFRIHNGESGSVWSETLESATDIKVVSRLDNRSFSKLPLSSTRKKRESKVVGFASQAFHVPTDDDDLFPGYIAGNVVLPPRGIKDAEGVGLCSQVFNVGDCQPNSVEFALADPSGQDGEFDPKSAQRFLLNKGDMFQIPPGNVYRIENHSKTEKANLFWTIIKCTSRAEQEDSEEEED